MAKAIYVKFDTPEELANQAEEALKTAQDSGKVAKGTNEVTKFIERGDAALVVIAEDVDPAEIVAHIPVLADEKEIPYVYLPTKEQVGGAAGLTVGTASACIVDAGDAEAAVAEIVEKVVQSAAANADVKEMNADNLYVAEIFAHQGPTMKRWKAGSQGRASIILKRSSHVGCTLKEKEVN